MICYLCAKPASEQICPGCQKYHGVRGDALKPPVEISWRVEKARAPSPEPPKTKDRHWYFKERDGSGGFKLIVAKTRQEAIDSFLEKFPAINNGGAKILSEKVEVDGSITIEYKTGPAPKDPTDPYTWTVP